MAMKLDEFLALKQGDQTVLQYVGRFNHLSQYASEHVNTDAKKKKWFMRTEYQITDNDDCMCQCYLS